MANAPSKANRAAASAPTRTFAAPSAAAQAAEPAAASTSDRDEQDKTLPLPGWLTKVYFIFPVVLYIPDAIFNYFVYSDGAFLPANGNVVLQAAQVALWSFMSIGVVGMAYLLSVLAPWHWSQGHRIQAFFCGLGVLIATGITTWNSLAFRSTNFQTFATDSWVYQLWPQLKGISLTMILVAVAPPFWGLFWAIVQPTQTGRSLRQLRETHEERVLRMEQEAQLKAMKAEANAKVRAAQLRGLAQTAATARDQAAGLLGRAGTGAVVDGTIVTEEESGSSTSGEFPAVEGANRVLQLPTAKPGLPARGETVSMYNHAAAATPSVRTAPSPANRAVASQPSLLSDADVAQPQANGAGDPMPWGGARRPPVPGSGILGTFFDQDDQLTGTTGPRPVVKRPGENSPLFKGISADMSDRADSAVQTVYEDLRRELSADGTRRSLPKKDLVARFMDQNHVDEATAQRAVDHWYRSQKSKKG